MNTFKLSAAVNADKVFLIQKSAIDGRLDPLYYFSVNNLAIVKQTIYPVRRLSSVIEMTRGRFGHRPRNDPRFYGGQYPFIQTGDVVRASKSHGNITFSQTLNEQGLKTSRLFDKRVVVLTIAANIGDTAILDYPACFPDSLIGLQPKTDEMTLEYINVYFKFIRQYLNDLAPQAAQKNINYQQLAPIPIVVPPLTVQNQAVALYEAALRAQQQKHQQAAALLASINGYLLGELGITLPEQDNRLEKRMFYVNSREVTGGRFDPSWSFNAHYRVEGGIYENQLLSQVATVSKGTSITSAVIESGDYPVIAGGQSSPYSHRVFNQAANVITVSASGAYAGFVWHHDYPIFASDCSVIRSKDEVVVSTLFIAELLKLKQKEIYFLQQGAGQPHVYARDLVLLKLPIPPKAVQREILKHIGDIRTQAHTLQQHAEQILADAKAQVERMILGGE